MSKKEFISFMIVALGVWAVCMVLASLPGALTSIAAFVVSFGNLDSGMWIGLLTLGLVPMVAWAALALLLIKKANRWSEMVLRWAGISGDEQLTSISVGDILPTAISLIGLYIIVTRLPRFVITLVGWFALNANTSGIMPVLVPSEKQLSHALAELALVQGFAFFAFFRGRVLAGLVTKNQKK